MGSLKTLLRLALVLSMAPATALCGRPAPGADPPASGPGASAPATVRIPIGDTDLDVDDMGLEQKLGGAFKLGVRSGANSCYVEALRSDPNAKGEIAFVVKPPPGEGPFLVTLERRGLIGDAVVACVEKVFGAFYHYTDKEPWDQVEGTLRFEPEWITAPAPPTPEAVRPLLDRRYAPTGTVRIAKATLTSAWDDVERSSSEVIRRYAYDVDLEFTANGYEADCQHNGPYKVFSRSPYDASRYAGHSCESHAREAGDHASDTAMVVYHLHYYPSVGKWVLPGEEDR
ncbi:MAG TPA: hypothetical protein VFS60_19775 [Thermoanaerobaculia bacterium]|nr:hypothetical protein [Thermoanaerobaculia bacterium]